MKLTKEQAKMVIEFFSQQAAEDAPNNNVSWDTPIAEVPSWEEWDKHMWMTCYTVSLAIERIVNIKDWATLLNAQLDWQRFDRDPNAYMYERGEADWADSIDSMRDTLQDVLSATIDDVFNTSKPA